MLNHKLSSSCTLNDTFLNESVLALNFFFLFFFDAIFRGLQAPLEGLWLRFEDGFLSHLLLLEVSEVGVLGCLVKFELLFQHSLSILGLLVIQFDVVYFLIFPADFKPENMMTTFDSHQIKLIDFGLADSINVRRASSLIGNVRFSSRGSHLGYSSKKEDC